MDVATRIRDFISEEIMFEDNSTKLEADTPLLSGIVDSLALLQIVAFLEEEFDLQIDDSDMTAGHFRTIADIEALVRAKAPQG